jgi:hypothetical protein
MKKSINDNQKLTGKQQQQKYYEEPLKNDTFFPKGVHIDDIDRAARDEFKNNFEIVSEGKAVPFIDLFSIQRFSEYMKTWENTDETNTVLFPFILMVKDPNEKGSALGANLNIPSDITFPVWKRNIVKNGKATIEYYQIAQPVNIDTVYKLHIFTIHQRLINLMDELMLHKFKSSQNYINVNGHHMAMYMESMQDSSEVSNIDKRKYYQKTYTLKIKGYLLREEDFKQLPSIDKIDIKMGISQVKNSRECIVQQKDLNCDLCLNFKFNRKSEPSQTYRVPMDLEFYYDNQNPANDYSYLLNGNLVTLPFEAVTGDELTVAHNILNQNIINIEVCGKKLN